MEGIKHLIECQCILPQYKNKQNPIFHKFTVFSVLENDQVHSSYVECNNCGCVHKIIDLCRSEIMVGKEDLRSVLTKDDISLTLPSELTHILESYSCDLATWYQTQFIFNQEKWSETITLTKEEIDDKVVGKLLKIVAKDKFKIEPFAYGVSIA